MNIVEAKDAMLKGARITLPEWTDGEGRWVRYWTIEVDHIIEHTLRIEREVVHELKPDHMFEDRFAVLNYELPEVVPARNPT